MKEPLETRDVECPTCHVKAGQPCTKPTNQGGRPILGDHSARFQALSAARETWEKWRHWHDGITPAEADRRALRRHDEEQYRESVYGSPPREVDQ